MTTYALRPWEESGDETTAVIIAGSLDEAESIARDKAMDWIEGGDWGEDGARVRCRYSIADGNGEEIDGFVIVEIEPGPNAPGERR